MLNDLKPIMYQKFLNNLIEEGYSKRTVEIVHGTMYGAYEKALSLGNVKKNPCHSALIKGKYKDELFGDPKRTIPSVRL